MNQFGFTQLNCEQVQRQLTKLTKPDPAEPAVTAHLAACSVCAAELATTQRLQRALQTAVQHSAPAPAALRARILNEIALTNQPLPAPAQPTSWWTNWRASWLSHWQLPQWGLAAAAALALFFVGYRFAQRNAPTAPTVATVNATRTHDAAAEARDWQVLRVGLHDHVHCAVERDYSAGPVPLAQMTASLGPDFSELLPVVQQQVPQGFAVLLAHHCQFEERRFIHFILSDQRTLLSLILTRKEKAEAAFDPRHVGAILDAAGVAVHHAQEQSYTVAGFESPAYLGFLVSNLSQPAHLQLAAQLAPAVQAWLLRRAG